ncbi:hypothetical protein E1B25_15675 [Antarcticimicrobium sediminis]|uniref:Uncharacterized protein n=1 Tax=Antarcticimicrobium sediminis TaxID=2546227 RepID=A0A4R5ENB1_9RHOB|nr:hypothetical protein E1B25_15675 [Antarcticimicrobium sediminis]
MKASVFKGFLFLPPIPPHKLPHADFAPLERRIRAMERLRTLSLGRLHSRKLGSFDETPSLQG